VWATTGGFDSGLGKLADDGEEGGTTERARELGGNGSALFLILVSWRLVQEKWLVGLSGGARNG